MGKEYSSYIINNIKKAQKVLKVLEVAKEKRLPFEPLWEDVANYVLPYRGGFYTLEPSVYNINLDSQAEVYDDTAIIALQRSASALYSFTANPATKWFSFTVPITHLKNKQNAYNILNSKEVKDYLVAARDTTIRYLNKAISSAMYPLMQEAMAFSTSSILISEEEDSNLIMSGKAVSMRDSYILEGRSGLVDTVIRVLKLSNEQAVKEFGQENLHPVVQDEIKQGDFYKDRVYIHFVSPRKEWNPDSPFNLDKPIASIYVDYANSFIVKESGYDEMPYGVARINVPASFVYGFAPGMNVRHTVKGLNKLCRQKLEAGDKALNPPMNVPMDTYPNPLSFKPAAINYHEVDSQRLMSPVNDFGNIQIADSSIQDSRITVKEGLLTDLVQPTKGDTTYQNQQEQLLQMRLMAPWQGGFERDLLDNIVKRAFGILSRRSGVLPDMPAILKDLLGGHKLALNYESPLAKAQQFIVLQGIDRTIQFAGGLGPVGGMDSIDVHQAVEVYAELSGAPGTMVRSAKQVEAIQKQRADMQKQQAQLQAQQNMAQQMDLTGKAAKNISGSDINKLKEFLTGSGAMPQSLPQVNR